MSKIAELKKQYTKLTLAHILEEYDNMLSTCKPSEEPEIFLEASKLLNYSNIEKAESYSSKVIAHKEVIKNSELYVEANNLKAWSIFDTLQVQNSINLILESIEISKQLNFTRLYIDSKISLAMFFLYDGKEAESKEILHKSYDEAIEYGDIELIIQSLTVLVNVYQESDFDKAGKYINEALYWGNKLNYKWVIGYLNFLYATWLKENNQLQESVEIVKYNLELFKTQGADHWYIHTVKKLASLLLDLKNPDDAICYLSESLAMLNSKSASRHIANIYNLLAKCYLMKKDFEQVKKFNKMSEDLCNELGVISSFINYKTTLADLHIELELYDEALKWYLEIFEKYDQNILLSDRISLYNKLQKTYAKLNMFDKAYEYLLLNRDLKLQQVDEEKVKSMAEMQTKYESEKKEAQLKELKIDQLNSELKALKSQMNPHFIFNVMSTVDSLIEIGEQDKARKSLRMFSKMMRNTLEQSNEDTILLEDEISLLESYITLEKLLLGDDFNFEINVDEEIDTSYDTIPAMLLQPIIENAIKHGLKHKLGKKDLKVSFKLIDEVLNIEIEDNGIGRIASAKINESRKNHQSFATKSIEDRIHIINEQHAIKIAIDTIDKYDEQKNATGTLVSIKIIK